MIRGALLATVFFASAFGLSQDDMDPDPDADLANVCYFGHPSRKCEIKCLKQDAEAFCQGKSGTCECRKSTQVQTNYDQAGGNQPEPEHQDLSSLFFTGQDQGDYQPEAQTTAQPHEEEQVILMKDYCFFGEYPSLACKSKCSHLRLVSYCQDDEKNKTCLCRENQPEDVQELSTNTPDYADYCWFGEFPSTACRNKCGEDEPVCEHRHCLCSNTFGVLNPVVPATTPTETEEEEEDQAPESSLHHTILYLYNFGGLFGAGNKTDSETTQGQGQGQPILSTSPPTTLHRHHHDSGWSCQQLAAVCIAVLLVLLIVLEVYSLLKKRKAKNMQSVFNQTKI